MKWNYLINLYELDVAWMIYVTEDSRCAWTLIGKYSLIYMSFMFYIRYIMHIFIYNLMCNVSWCWCNSFGKSCLWILLYLVFCVLGNVYKCVQTFICVKIAKFSFLLLLAWPGAGEQNIKNKKKILI